MYVLYMYFYVKLQVRYSMFRLERLKSKKIRKRFKIRDKMAKLENSSKKTKKKKNHKVMSRCKAIYGFGTRGIDQDTKVGTKNPLIILLRQMVR